MDPQKELEAICSETPGCRAAILMNLDGLTVLRHVADQEGPDDEILLVEMTGSLKQAIQAVASVEGGDLTEFEIGFEKGVLLIRLLKDEHFIAMLLEPTAVAGKGRYVLRNHSQPLVRELF